MPDKKEIEKISDHTKEVILRKSSYGLPTRPTENGMQEAEIKKAFYAPILDEEYSVIAEMDRMTEEANTVLTEMQEDTNALQAKHDAFVEKATKDIYETNLCIYSLADVADELKVDFKDLSREWTKYKGHVDKEIERIEGKIDTGIDQEEVERNVIKAVVPLIDRESIGIDKVDNTADIDKPVSTLQQEAITRATSIAKAEITESFTQNLQASLVALNDSLTGEIAKKEESLIEKITAEQTARAEEDTAVKGSITQLQAELQAKDTMLERQIQAILEQNAQMQAEIQALKDDREQIIKDSWLYNHPVNSTIIAYNNFDPNTKGGTWELEKAGYALWTTQGTDALGAGVVVNNISGSIAAGLPNLTGMTTDFRMNTNDINGQSARFTGVFYTSGWSEHYTFKSQFSGNVYESVRIGFDASRGGKDAIYGKSNTVQPPAVKIRLWKRIA